jgi:DNA ligase-1
MRFPRVSRIRWDKPAREANTLDDVMDLLDAIEGGGGRIAQPVA